MQISIFDRLRPFLSKILASILVPILAWLAGKTKFWLFADPEFAKAVQEIAMVWLSLALAHTGLSKIFNPGNTASAHLAKTHADEAATLKKD